MAEDKYEDVLQKVGRLLPLFAETHSRIVEASCELLASLRDEEIRQNPVDLINISAIRTGIFLLAEQLERHGDVIARAMWAQYALKVEACGGDCECCGQRETEEHSEPEALNYKQWLN